MAPAQNSSKEFRFLAGLTPTYDSEIRAFVLQDYVRQRRMRAQARKRKNSHPLNRAGCGGSNSDELHLGVKEAKEQANGAAKQEGLAISKLLSQGRLDPFQCFATELDSVEHRLLDHYVLGDHPVFGDPRHQSFNPSRDLIIQWSLQDKMGIWATLAYTACNLEWQGGLPPAVYSSKYRALTCNAINKRLEVERNFPSIPLVVTVCGTICMIAERKLKGGEPEDSHELCKHIKGLHALLAARGGWRATAAHSDMMAWLLAWVDIVTAGAASSGFTSPFSHTHSAPAQAGTHLDVVLYAYRLGAEELIGAYADFHQTAVARRRGGVGRDCSSPARTRSLLDLFQVGTPAYHLLCVGRAKLVSRIAPLFYLNILAWNFRHYPTDCLAQLHDSYARRLQAVGISHTQSFDTLMWGLMTDTDANCVVELDLLDLLGRLLNVAKDLAPSTQDTLARTLLSFLQHEGQPPDVAQAWWTPGQFRDVVQGDLGGV